MKSLGIENFFGKKIDVKLIETPKEELYFYNRKLVVIPVDERSHKIGISKFFSRFFNRFNCKKDCKVDF